MPTLLSPDDIQHQIKSLSDWTYTDKALERTITFPHFLSGISFINAVAHAAEREDHHPDIDIRYTKVTLRYATHSAGGVTELDMAGAKEVNMMLPHFLKE